MSVETAIDGNELLQKIEKSIRKLSKIRVGSDIDNTEVSTTENGILLLNKIQHSDFKTEDVTYDFAIIDLIAEKLPKVSNPREYAIELWNCNENLSTARPVSGLLSVSHYLNKFGLIDIPRITSRPAYAQDVTFSWYQKNMPWVVDHKLIYMQKGAEINPDYKIDQINKMGIELFFEDSFEHAIRIVSETRSTVVLVPQPWNENYILNRTPNDRIIIPHKDWRTPAKMVRVYAGLVDYI